MALLQVESQASWALKKAGEVRNTAAIALHDYYAKVLTGEVTILDPEIDLVIRLHASANAQEFMRFLDIYRGIAARLLGKSGEFVLAVIHTRPTMTVNMGIISDEHLGFHKGRFDTDPKLPIFPVEDKRFAYMEVKRPESTWSYRPTNTHDTVHTTTEFASMWSQLGFGKAPHPFTDKTALELAIGDQEVTRWFLRWQGEDQDFFFRSLYPELCRALKRELTERESFQEDLARYRVEATAEVEETLEVLRTLLVKSKETVEQARNAGLHTNDVNLIDDLIREIGRKI